MKQLGGLRGLVGVLFASGLVGLQVGFVVGDQLAKAYPWADTLGGRLLVMAVGWGLLLAWALGGERRSTL